MSLGPSDGSIRRSQVVAHGQCRLAAVSRHPRVADRRTGDRGSDLRRQTFTKCGCWLLPCSSPDRRLARRVVRPDGSGPCRSSGAVQARVSSSIGSLVRPGKG